MNLLSSEHGHPKLLHFREILRKDQARVIPKVAFADSPAQLWVLADDDRYIMSCPVKFLVAMLWPRVGRHANLMP